MTGRCAQAQRARNGRRGVSMGRTETREATSVHEAARASLVQSRASFVQSQASWGCKMGSDKAIR